MEGVQVERTRGLCFIKSNITDDVEEKPVKYTDKEKTEVFGDLEANL